MTVAMTVGCVGSVGMRRGGQNGTAGTVATRARFVRDISHPVTGDRESSFKNVVGRS